MKIHFFEPPPVQRAGGLDAAISSLRAALERSGVEVSGAMPATDAGAVVHFHGLWQPQHARLSAEFASRGIPCAASPHGMLEPWAWRHKWWKKWPYFQLREKHHLRRARALLATAPAEAERLQKFFPHARVEVLPLGMTGEARPDYEKARAQLAWPDGERVLLFLSRLHVKKGLHLLLQALAGLGGLPPSRLVIVGGGDAHYVAAVRALAETLRPRLPRIDWIGEVWGEERWKYFQGADLFCLPTHSENFGLAVLEACQVGTRALTTNTTPWCDELDGGRGFICTPEVASIRGELAAFFSTPLTSPAERAALANWAWKKFHWDALAPRYVKFYESTLVMRQTA